MGTQIENVSRRLSGARKTNVDGQWYVPRLAIDEIIDKSSISDIMRESDLYTRSKDKFLDRSQLPGLVDVIHSTGKIGFAVLCHLGPEYTKYVLNLKRHAESKGSGIDRLLPWAEQELLGSGLNKVQAGSFVKAQWHYNTPKLLLRGVNETPFPPDTILPIKFSSSRSCAAKEGASGSVAKVEIEQGHQDPPYSHPLARKQFHAHRSQEDYRRELRNLSILSTLKHENIIKPLSAYVHNDTFNFLFPLVDGSLRDVFEGEDSFASHVLKDDESVLLALCGLSSALVTLHNFNMEDDHLIGCHRDIKPANILVHGERLLLADVGLSTIVDGSEESSGAIPAATAGVFNAPEHQGRNKTGRSSDIWSFGCLILMLVVFHLEKQPGIAHLEAQRKTQRSELTHSFFHDFERSNPGVTEALAELAGRPSLLARGLSFLVQKMLAFQVDERPKADVVDKYLRLLAIFICSNSIEQALGNNFGTQDPQQVGFQRWRSMVKITDSDFPDLSMSLNSVSNDVLEEIARHLRDLRTMLTEYEVQTEKGPSSIRSDIKHIQDVLEDKIRTESQYTKRILKEIGKLALLRHLPAKSNICWDDVLLPYSEDQLPPEWESTTEFLEAQKTLLSDITPSFESIYAHLINGSKKFPQLHIRMADIGEFLHIGKVLDDGRAGTIVEKVEPRRFGERDEVSTAFAMKLMQKPTTAQNPNLSPQARITVEEFKTEISNLRKCDHPHLISPCAIFTDMKHFGIIMSPVAESSLQGLLDKYVDAFYLCNEEQNHDREVLRSAFGCLLEALNFLHGVGIRHRDLKPKNILLHKGRVRICDFGSAYDWEPVGRRESTTGSQVGTKRYQAPEVLSGRVHHTSKTDIFSLGCVFLEMHTVLRGMTLNQMACKVIRSVVRARSYNDDWTYESSLSGLKLWLNEPEKRAQNDRGPLKLPLVPTMLSENSEDRPSAQNLLDEVYEKHIDLIGDCCKTRRLNNDPGPDVPSICHNLDADPTSIPMKYSTGRPISKWKMKRREQDPSITDRLVYGEYATLTESTEECEIEIIEKHDESLAGWTTTRQLGFSSPSLQEFWLPAYFVAVTHHERGVILKWSDCDQTVKVWKDGLREFKKVHHSSPSMTNIRMEIDFINKSDAENFCSLVLRDPVEDKPVFAEMQLPQNKHLFVRTLRWETENLDDIASGAQILTFRSSLGLRPYQRLDLLFLPDEVDFTLVPCKDAKTMQLVLKPVCMPQYISDQDLTWEDKEVMANFKNVKLVTVRNGLPIQFKDDPTSFKHVRESQHTEHGSHGFQDFLRIITGSNLIVCFSVRAHRKLHPKKRVGDLFCWRNQDEQKSRLSIRWRKPTNEPPSWTTATLISIENSGDNRLHAQLAGISHRHLLDLSNLKAAGGRETTGMDKSQTWFFQVEDGSAIPAWYNRCKQALSKQTVTNEAFVPVRSELLTMISKLAMTSLVDLIKPRP